MAHPEGKGGEGLTLKAAEWGTRFLSFQLTKKREIIRARGSQPMTRLDSQSGIHFVYISVFPIFLSWEPIILGRIVMGFKCGKIG